MEYLVSQRPPLLEMPSIKANPVGSDESMQVQQVFSFVCFRFLGALHFYPGDAR